MRDEKQDERRLPATWEEFDRAVRLREREAFVAGTAWGVRRFRRTMVVGVPYPTEEEGVIEAARRLYPITRKVPRILRDESPAQVEWKYAGGDFFARSGNGWEYSRGYEITPDRVRVWSDLLANPYEEVEE